MEYSEYRFIEVEIDPALESVQRLVDFVTICFSQSELVAHADSSAANVLTLGLKEVDVVEVRNKLTGGKINQDVGHLLVDRIASIRSYGLKNGKRVFVGYNGERKVVNRNSKVKQRGIHYYADGEEFDKSDNELPNEYLDKIICADSYDTLKALPDSCVDIVLTSPPYNFGLGYSDSPDEQDWNKYFEDLFRILDECIRVLKYGGRLIVNVQPLFSDYIPSHHIISSYLMGRKLIWKGEVLWEKNNYNCKYTAWGSWKSPSNPYLKYTWEFLEIFCKGTMKKPALNGVDSDISADEFKSWVVARWSIAPERRMKEFGHPAMFPEQLVERCLKLFSWPGDIVLDPFNGAGTTTLVAKRLGRRYIGIDLSKEYCEQAQQRLDGYNSLF